MTTRIYTADLHVGHVNMTKQGKDLCGRPFDTVDEMNTALIDNINSVAATVSDPELHILGDICMGKLDESLTWLSLIECPMVLYPGNHDRFSLAYQRKGDRIAKIQEAAERYSQAANGAEVKLERLDKPSEFIAPFIDPAGWPVKMSHYPYVGDSHGEDRHADMRPRNEGGAIIHGHVHEEWKVNGNQFNVGVDVNDFKPVLEEEILTWLETL